MEKKEFEKSMKTFLEAGVHFGHKSNIWNPNMKKYVFIKRNGVHIIDLQKTVLLFDKAYNYVKNICANGGKILFVGTKKQAKVIIDEEVPETGHYYISNRWIGGLLTNNKTIRKSIDRLKELNDFLEDEEKQKSYLKKQILKLRKERDRLKMNFQGVLHMDKLPDLIFIVDAFHEKNCVQEAKIMGIPTCAMVDTNSDPSGIDLVIPSNDDAIRSINFFVTNIVKAIKEGEKIFKKNQQIEDLAEDYDRIKKSEKKQKENKKEIKENPTETVKPEDNANKENNKPTMNNKENSSDNAVKVSDIKELRELTNIGMMECKKALVEAKGDKEKAIKILKEKGLAIIAKRKDKSANEGVVFVKAEKGQGWIVKVNCETDFVAKSESFQGLVEQIGEHFVQKGTDFLKDEEFSKVLNETIAQTKEKIEIKDPLHLASETGIISHYLHSNKKIGVLIELVAQDATQKEALEGNEKIQSFAKDLAMQVAAMNPVAISLEDISEELREEQKGIFLKQLEKEKKDPNILDKIIEGKVTKYFSEQCLLEMESIKEDKKKVKDLVREISEQEKVPFKIKQFKRFQIGG